MVKADFLTEYAITDGAKYERNANVAFDAETNTMWMFWAYADTIVQRSGGDIDNEFYMIYFSKSTDKGNTWSTPALLNKTRPTGFTQRDISTIIINGDIYVFVSSGDSGTYRPLIYYVSSDKGLTWTDAVAVTIPGQAIDPNNPLGGSRLGHTHVIYENNKFHLVYQTSGGSIVRYSSSSDAVTWSAYSTLYGSAHYVPKIMILNNKYYVVTVKGAVGEVWLATSTDASSWTTNHILGSTSAWGDWDPFIGQLFDNSLAIIWAPNIGSDGQQLKISTSTDDGVNWSAPVDLTPGFVVAQEWWDYWPQIFRLDNQIFIFYTSERDKDNPTFDGGNIWILKALPLVTAQPKSKIVFYKQTTKFTTEVAENDPASLQWQKDNVDISGANEKNLTILETKLSDAGTYNLNVEGTISAAESNNAVLEVKALSDIQDAVRTEANKPIVAKQLENLATVRSIIRARAGHIL